MAGAKRSSELEAVKGTWDGTVSAAGWLARKVCPPVLVAEVGRYVDPPHSSCLFSGRSTIMQRKTEYMRVKQTQKPKEKEKTKGELPIPEELPDDV